MHMELVILGFFVVGIVFILVNGFMAERKAKVYTEDIEQLKKEILVSTTEQIPDKKIIKTLGIVTGVSKQATMESEFKKAELEALYNMLKKAKKLGANAVVGVKVETGTYQTEGAKWQVAQIIYQGTAVIVEDKAEN